MVRAGEPARPLVLRGLDGAPGSLSATAALSWNSEAFRLAFSVEAEPPLVVTATPAWANDCVEAFLADAATPCRYLEVVLDAAGALYTARVENPDGSRTTWSVAPQPPPAGLEAVVEGDGAPGERTRWSARLAIPWAALGLTPAPGLLLRGNLFRIARGAAVRHLALSPTGRTAPPDFHVPARFATFRLA